MQDLNGLRLRGGCFIPKKVQNFRSSLNTSWIIFTGKEISALSNGKDKGILFS
jgi:hypothetical protein